MSGYGHVTCVPQMDELLVKYSQWEGGGGHAAAFPLGFIPFALHGRKQVGEKIILSTRRISTALRIQVNARIARLPPNPADGCRFYFFFFFFF